MKSSKIIVITLMLSVFFVFNGCKKDGDNSAATPRKNAESVTILFPVNSGIISSRHATPLNGASSRSGCAAAANMVGNYAFIYTNSGGGTWLLSLPEIHFHTSTAVKPATTSLIVNGHSFPLTYIGMVTSLDYKYSFTPVTLAQLGVTNPSTFTSCEIDYVACGLTVDMDFISTPFSPPPQPPTIIQPNAYAGSSAGQLVLSVPFVSPPPAGLIYPSYYEFQYSKTNPPTTGWLPATPIRRTYAQYSTGDYTVTGLAAGTYKVQGRGVASGGTATDWAPDPNIVTVN